MYQNLRVAIIIPAYQEEERIEGVLRGLPPTISATGHDCNCPLIARRITSCAFRARSAAGREYSPTR